MTAVTLTVEMLSRIDACCQFGIDQFLERVGSSFELSEETFENNVELFAQTFFYSGMEWAGLHLLKADREFQVERDKILKTYCVDKLIATPVKERIAIADKFRTELALDLTRLVFRLALRDGLVVE